MPGGGQSGTLAIENDSNNQQPSAGYDFTCGGLAPMVVINPTAVGLNIATVPAASDSDTFNVFNDNSDGLSSNTNVTVTVGAVTGPAPNPAINATPLGFSLAAGADQDVTVECSGDENTEPGTHTADVTVEWDVPGGTEDETVTVTCEITEERPGYTSDPAPGSVLAFGEVRGGEQSDSQFIDVGNEDSSGTSQAAELNVTGVNIAGGDAAHFAVIDFAPFTLAPGAANGSDSIEVQCQPQAIGSFTDATLEVESNDADSPHTYPLTCEGGLAPMVVVDPTAVGLSIAAVPAASDSDTFNVFNDNSDGFSNDTNVTVTVGGVTGPPPNPAINVTPLNFGLAAGADQDVTVECSGDENTEPGIHTDNVTIEWTVPDGTASQNVAVTCEVTPPPPDELFSDRFQE